MVWLFSTEGIKWHWHLLDQLTMYDLVKHKLIFPPQILTVLFCMEIISEPKWVKCQHLTQWRCYDLPAMTSNPWDITNIKLPTILVTFIFNALGLTTGYDAVTVRININHHSIWVAVADNNLWLTSKLICNRFLVVGLINILYRDMLGNISKFKTRCWKLFSRIVFLFRLIFIRTRKHSLAECSTLFIKQVPF